MTVVLYGLPSCDAVRRARAWLDGRSIDYSLHDYRRQGVPPDRVHAWIPTVGWEVLINRRGTTWRKLDEEATKAGIVNAGSARALMLAHPSVIRRPVIERDGRVLAVGFDAGAMRALAGSPA